MRTTCWVSLYCKKVPNKYGVPSHTNKTRNHYNVKFSSSIALKCFSAQTPSTLMHWSNLGMGFNFRTQSRTTVSTSSSLCNWQHRCSWFIGQENGLILQQESHICCCSLVSWTAGRSTLLFGGLE